MIFDEQTYDLISAYMDGSLSPEERLSFEQRLANEPDLQAEVSDMQTAHEFMNDLHLVRLRSDLQEGIKTQKTRKRNIKTGLALLTGVVIITLIVLYSRKDHNHAEVIKKEPTLAQTKTKKKAQNPTPDQKEEGQKSNFQTSVKSTPTKPTQTAHTESSSTDSVLRSDSTAHIPSVSFQSETESHVTSFEKKAISPENNTSLDMDCQTINIQADVKVTPSCEDSETGIIAFSNLRGGQAPYTIYSESGESNLIFTALPSGLYAFYIQDNNGCKTQLEKEITDVFCTKDLTFSPDIDDEIVLYRQENTTGTVRIINRSGLVIFNSIFTNEFIWNGIASNGNMSNEGYYIYIIQLENGEKHKNSITIIR